jgi:hypothetical protein
MVPHGAETRGLLLTSLKNAIGNLTCRTMGEPVKGQMEAQPVPATLDDGVKEVRAVMVAVEQCLFHGLRVEQFKGVHPFWPLLERLESAIQPPDHKFNNTVAAIAVVSAGLPRGFEVIVPVFNVCPLFASLHPGTRSPR